MSLPAEIADACRRVIEEDDELAQLVEPILKATKATPVCEYKLHAPKGNAPLGGTKLGGFPDLPAHVEWPKFQDRYLPFIAQVNLAELPALEDSPLPASGWLYYFYWCTNEVEGDPAAVVWLPDGAAQGEEAGLARREVPVEQILVDWQGAALYEEERATRFSLGVSVSIPLVQRFAQELGLADEYERCDEIELLWPDFATEYPWEVQLRLEHGLDIWERLEAEGDEEGIEREYWPLIELLGYPDPLGYFLCDLEAAPGGHTDGTDLWQNILHISSSGNMLWSDVGTLGFFVRDDDLRRRDFSRLQVQVMSS